MTKNLMVIVGVLVAMVTLSACTNSWVCNSTGQLCETQQPDGSQQKPPVVPDTVPPEQAAPDGTPVPAAPQANNACPQARDLGPWAPDNKGNGETFEVTASDHDASNLSSAGVVLDLWWPKGSGQKWGTQEITVFVPRGLSITVINGAGRGWDYERNCSDSLLQAEMDAHMLARKDDTAYWGEIKVEDLIASGLVEVRFDRRPTATK